MLSKEQILERNKFIKENGLKTRIRGLSKFVRHLDLK